MGILTPYLPDLRRDWLDACQQSVARQTYPDVRHLLLEDTHRNGIPSMLNRLLTTHANQIDAWVCMGGDDMLPDDAISHLVEAWLSRDRKPDLVFGGILGMNEAGALRHRPVGEWTFDRQALLGGQPTLPSAALHPIRLWHTVGPYDELLVHGREDQAWFVTACMVLPTFWPVRVPHITYWHREHEGSLTKRLRFHHDEWAAGFKRARKRGRAA